MTVRICASGSFPYSRDDEPKSDVVNVSGIIMIFRFTNETDFTHLSINAFSFANFNMPSKVDFSRAENSLASNPSKQTTLAA
jgi:hypothetical protein